MGVAQFCGDFDVMAFLGTATQSVASLFWLVVLLKPWLKSI